MNVSDSVICNFEGNICKMGEHCHTFKVVRVLYFLHYF